MKSVQLLVATLLLVASPLILADKPDPPTPNPPIQVWIAGGEVIEADVNVMNLPAVQEVTGSVEVTNAPEVKEPYRAFDTSGSGNEQVYFEAVESGKRLYIEYVSLRATTNLDSTVFCWISAYDMDTLDTNARHWIVATKIDPPDSGHDQFIASTPVTLNIEAGEQPEVGCYIDPIHEYQVSASIAGYMVDVPSP